MASTLQSGPVAMPSARVTEPRRRRLRSRHLAGWLCLLPFLTVNFLVILGPSLSTFYYSLTDWNGIGPATYIGLQNFRDLTHDHNFHRGVSARHHLDLLLSDRPDRHGIARVVPALADHPRPDALPAALFHSRTPSPAWSTRRCGRTSSIRAKGFFAQLDKLGVPGMDDISIFGSTRNALWGVAWVDNWHWWGFLVVVFLAAMQTVDQELYDAVKLDGGGRWREFRDVTVPGILPTLIFILLLTIIASLLVFDYIYIITQGGPAGSTEMVGTLLYKTAFEMFEAGYAAAMGVTMTVLSVLIMLGYRSLQRRGWEI